MKFSGLELESKLVADQMDTDRQNTIRNWAFLRDANLLREVEIDIEKLRDNPDSIPTPTAPAGEPRISSNDSTNHRLDNTGYGYVTYGRPDAKFSTGPTAASPSTPWCRLPTGVARWEILRSS